MATSGGSWGNNPFYQEGTNQDSFSDDFTNRGTEGVITGGLSGFSNLSHDWKRAFGKKPGGSTIAADTFAALTRQQWADYQKDIIPYENKLIEFANDAEAPNEAMARAQATIGQAFDNQQTNTSDRLRGLGLTLNADETQAFGRSSALARSAAEVHAMNTAGEQTRSLQRAVLGNPTPQIESLKQ